MEYAAEGLEQSASREAEAVRLAKAGDKSVWAAWHDAYYPLLYRYALARLQSKDEAEDIAAQVFLEALQGIGRYREQGRPVLAWLYGIARHLVAARRRRLSQQGQPLEDAGEPVGERFEAETDEKLLLQAALSSLKAEHSEVLILRFLLDLPLREVAAMIGKSEAATYSLQTRAMSALRALLEKEKSEIVPISANDLESPGA